MFCSSNQSIIIFFCRSHVNQISGGITIVKVGGNQSPTNSNITRTTQTDNNGRNSRLVFIQYTFNLKDFIEIMCIFLFNRIVITPRPRLMADSRSTGRLQSSNAHRSMTRLNAGKKKIITVYVIDNDKVYQ